jgi:hypothetical protein
MCDPVQILRADPFTRPVVGDDVRRLRINPAEEKFESRDRVSSR